MIATTAFELIPIILLIFTVLGAAMYSAASETGIESLTTIPTTSILILQGWVRGLIVRRRSTEMKRAGIVLQRYIRGCFARRTLAGMKCQPTKTTAEPPRKAAIEATLKAVQAERMRIEQNVKEELERKAESVSAELVNFAVLLGVLTRGKVTGALLNS